MSGSFIEMRMHGRDFWLCGYLYTRSRILFRMLDVCNPSTAYSDDLKCVCWVILSHIRYEQSKREDQALSKV